MKFAKPAFVALVWLLGAAAAASASPTLGEFPWQIGGVIHVPPPPHG